ncbi:DNase I-like protein [Atractiella rhizophila]|nr:DNase I-like protein [Atractiella rhizophila]
MAFKTAVHNPADEGRYLWCGTKDGQLFEIDILRQEVTDSKSAAHSYAIKGIFALGPTMITVDEGGKVVIWLPSAKEEFGLSLPPLLSSKNTKTQRVGEKLGFIKILGDQLWTSTGPSSPHPQTHSKLKATTGPTIRVYDPNPSSERPFVLTQRPLAFPSTEASSSSSSSPSSSAPVIGGVGAVTCGTIVPSHPERVYLGHESGHVSMWNKENMTCMGVLKISQSKITALQGVTRFLWAGYGSGFVFVYDIDVEPWRVQKAWKAHKDPVVDILVDPYTLWANGQLQVASICADATIHFWDGLMKQDWRDNRLLDLQPTYCNFRTIRILICTYNLDASKPENLLQNVKNQSFFHRLLSESGQPDIIVFGFQEMIDLENKRLTAKTLLLGKKKPDQKFNDSISNGYRLWHDELVRALKTYMPSNFPYTVTHVENLVGLFTCVFVKDTERPGLRDVSLMTVKTGMKGRYGNKGAILSRLVMDDTSMCFVNCHLAAGQNHRRQRNKNLIEILEKAALDQAGVDLAYISGGDGTMVFDHEICFLNGDLNYRIDLRRENVLKAVEEGDLKPLLLEDQLNKEMKTNAAFRLRSFKEAPISFLPTYKYDPGTDNYDSSPKLRIPAWCDRILWRADRHEKVKNLKYERHEVDISDHRPVSGLFEVQIKSIIPERLAKAQEGLDVEWKQVEAGLMEKARSFYQRT